MPAKRTKKAKTKFEIEAPNANSVLLAGEFTGWDSQPIELKKKKNGTWKTTVSLPQGSHQYRFVIDGVWCDDPQASDHVSNPFGSQNCVRDIQPD